MSEKQIITCQVCGKTYEYTPKGDGSPHPYQDELMGFCGEPVEPKRRGKARPLRFPAPKENPKGKL